MYREKRFARSVNTIGKGAANEDYRTGLLHTYHLFDIRGRYRPSGLFRLLHPLLFNLGRNRKNEENRVRQTIKRMGTSFSVSALVQGRNVSHERDRL